MVDEDRFYSQSFRASAPRSMVARLLTVVAAVIVAAFFAGAMPGDASGDHPVETRATALDASPPGSTDPNLSGSPSALAVALCRTLGAILPGCAAHR